VPTREDNSKNVNFYPTKSEKQPYDDLVDFNHQVIPSLGSDLKSLLGTGKVLGESDTLNPD
jgi:hypothetical protein